MRRARRLTVALAALGAVLTFAGCHRGASGNQPNSQPAAAAGSAGTTPQAGADSGGIFLRSGVAQRAGIRTIVLEPAAHGAEITLPGTIIPDSSRIVTVRAPLAGRLVTLAHGSWPALGASVAAGQTLGRVSDARALTAPRAGTVTNVPAQPGEIVAAGQPLLEITDFSHPLAGIVWQGDAPTTAAPPHRITIEPFSSRAAGVAATLVGSAPAVDPLSRAPVYLYRATHGWPGARPGAPVTAHFTDPHATARGLLVPTSAVVQWNGFAWVYVERADGRFARVRLDTSHPVAGGYLAATGLAAGARIVVRGAEQLLSEEFRASTSGGGDD